MNKNVITITYPDGSKKLVVGRPSNGKPISSNNIPVKIREVKSTDRRPKPGTPKISIGKERNGYKNGGKVKP